MVGAKWVLLMWGAQAAHTRVMAAVTAAREAPFVMVWLAVAAVLAVTLETGVAVLHPALQRLLVMQEIVVLAGAAAQVARVLIRLEVVIVKPQVVVAAWVYWGRGLVVLAVRALLLLLILALLRAVVRVVRAGRVEMLVNTPDVPAHPTEVLGVYMAAAAVLV